MLFTPHRATLLGISLLFALTLTACSGGEERQQKYRQLCDQYLREQGLIDDDPSKEMEARFIGNSAWCKRRRDEVREGEKARAAPS